VGGQHATGIGGVLQVGDDPIRAEDEVLRSRAFFVNWIGTGGELLSGQLSTALLSCREFRCRFITVDIIPTSVI